MCAVIPRHLGKGAKTPPPLHPPLERPEPGIEPVPAACSVSPLHHDQRETALSLCNPIAQDWETSLSHWTIPWTGRFAAGPRMRSRLFMIAVCLPDAEGPATEDGHGG